MTISVIIPIYNVENYLQQCLESVLMQDFEDFEVIGIDDYSTDSSVKVFEKFLYDARFKLIRHHENLGLPSARNSGLFKAKGSYVYFLDSDDWIAPHTLSTLHKLIKEDKVQIAIGGIVRYEEDTKSVICPNNHRRIMESPFRSKTVFERPALFHSVISCAKLIEMQFLKDTGLFFKSSPRRFEDMLTYKWYLRGALVSTTPEVTYFYRKRASDSGESSITQSGDWSAYTDKFLSYTDILRFTQDEGFFETEFDPLNSVYAMMELPKIIVRFLREVRRKLLARTNSDSETDEILRMILALKGLLELLPNDYVQKLPLEAQKTHSFVVSNSVPKVLNDWPNLKLTS